MILPNLYNFSKTNKSNLECDQDVKRSSKFTIRYTFFYPQSSFIKYPLITKPHWMKLED